MFRCPSARETSEVPSLRVFRIFAVFPTFFLAIFALAGLFFFTTFFFAILALARLFALLFAVGMAARNRVRPPGR